MFSNRPANKKINKFLQRALRIAKDGCNLKFEELFTKDGSVTIHHQNINTLAIEMFIDLFHLFHNYSGNKFYSLRSQPDLQIKKS